MDYSVHYSPHSYAEEQHEEYYKKEDMFNHSFQQSYNSATHVPFTQLSHAHALYGQQDYSSSYVNTDAMYSEHVSHSEAFADMSDTNDSGVNSEDNDHNNDENKKPINNNKSDKPLSAWKAKQLKLSAAGVIKRRKMPTIERGRE